MPDYGQLLAERTEAVPAGNGVSVDLGDPASVIRAAREGATVGDFREALPSEVGVYEEVPALPHHRLAENFESLRQAAAAFEAKNGSAPKLFLVNLGPLRKHKTRADFTRGFFSSGGFDVIYSKGVEDPDVAAKAFAASGARVAVVCGSDDQYAEDFESFARAIKANSPDATVVLAGNPGAEEARFRGAGMNSFIWIKSDNYETNREMLEKAGVAVAPSVD